MQAAKQAQMPKNPTCIQAQVQIINKVAGRTLYVIGQHFGWRWMNIDIYFLNTAKAAPQGT